MLNLNADQKKFADALAAAFTARGMNPRWGVALGLQETRLRPLINKSGPDGARGGSFGPTQISMKTARAFGFNDPMETLLDPVAAANLTADLVQNGFAERTVGGVSQVFYYGIPQTPEQMAAVWNAGRLDTDPDLPTVTAGEYIPSFLDFLGKVA